MTGTFAGEHPTPEEMASHGLTDADIPIWWAFLRECYPHVLRIKGRYDRQWWTWFWAGWIRGREVIGREVDDGNAS